MLLECPPLLFEYHYLLIMILLSSKIIRLFHFTRPVLSSFKSLKDLEAVLQKRLVANIKEVNAARLKHYSFISEITEQLKLTPHQAKQIQSRTVQLSLINAKSQQHQTMQVKLNQDLQKLALNPSDFGFPFPEPNLTMHHFSQFRGVPTFSQLNEYHLNSKKLMIFNLPDNITPQDIQVVLRAKQVKIRLQYCILGLIAYAEVEFPSTEELDSCLERFPTKTLQFGENERVARIRSLDDKPKLKLGNRRLVINIDEGRKLSEMIIQFSKYGRVLNIDWPVEAWINPTLEEVRKHYQDSSHLIKINQLFPDGTIQSEYCPALKVWQESQDERETENLIDKAERLEASYENRARFARNINIYPGRQHELMTSNKGYCVVTYSTYEECQNYYFATGSREKIQLVGDKLDFEYDPTYRRELLRHIDNEFLIGRKKEIASEQKFNKQNSHLIQAAVREKVRPNTEVSYKIADALLKKLSFQESMRKNRNYKIFRKKNRRDSSVVFEWKKYLNRMKEQKQKTKRQSFDQLAEIELYGRVLPKDTSKERLIIEDTTYTRHPYEEMIKQHRLITTVKQLYRRRKFYRRQIERNNRMADQRAGKVHAPLPEGHYSEGKGRYRKSRQRGAPRQREVPAQTTETVEVGKQAFSTGKPLPQYRRRTAQEQANYNRRFFQFMRNTIFEYMGIFQDKAIEEVADYKPQILNPQALKWPDGSPFLVEEDLTTILQFRRHFEKAQQDFNNYIFGSQFLKSSGENISRIFSNFTEHQTAALQYITDVGFVQEVKKVTGDNLQQKANILNAQIAKFGEEYRVEHDQNTNADYLIKIRKLEHLLPMDRVAHLQKFIAEHGGEISKSESQIFKKHYESMKQKDIIPDEVSDAFGVERGKKFSDLLAEVGAVYQISKKDLEMAERAKTYTSQELKRDLDNQMKLQKSRRNFRKMNSNSFAKDPSEIYVKDREGYYKVSRFRQI